MLVKTYGSAIMGVSARTITVETSVEPGVNIFMVGLPDNAVKESHHRIDTALKGRLFLQTEAIDGPLPVSLGAFDVVPA